MPIRSPRRLYLINLIEVNNDDDPDVIDRSPGLAITETKRSIVVKMKEGIGEYLGLTPMNWNDPQLSSIFKGGGLNLGQAYARRVGGFKTVSYTLLPETVFSIQEKFYDDDGNFQTAQSNFKSMTIGFPKGPTVDNVRKWLASTSKFDEIRGLRSPSGAYTDLYSPAKTN
ncbi:MAG: hypothetical protein HC930_02875 [Hydrococcus sp. SU_1_0]|nr:hypothetical protein [Hydrococcus sp. SU_1_0]